MFLHFGCNRIFRIGGQCGFINEKFSWVILREKKVQKIRFLNQYQKKKKYKTINKLFNFIYNEHPNPYPRHETKLELGFCFLFLFFLMIKYAS